ncbi:pathogenesis-related protein 1 precursor [Trifolium repens]|nr:pathogenesis-related protein 1 precursor [Trifolium repens]
MSSFSLLCVLGLFLIVARVALAQNSPIDYVNAHNAARSEVGVPNIVWNNTIADSARNYANERKADCQLIHSGGVYGENLAGSTGDLSGTDAVKLWVDEKSNYDYGSNSCADGAVCDHYTQAVWKTSLRLGCAKVRCDNGGTFIICNYDPPGNYQGQRPY